MASAKKSAGILMFRRKKELTEVLLVHPGGPFFAKKDLGAWSIPKGEYGDDELPLEVAKREFFEETGSEVSGDFMVLKPVRQKSGKVVSAWAVEGDLDATAISSNMFSMEWPPRSGKMREFPEVDRAEWFELETAKAKINAQQAALVDELAALLE